MSMIAKLNKLNQLQLPEAAIEAIGRPTSFDVEIDGGRLVLTPAKPITGRSVIEKLQGLNLEPADVADAIAWARQHR